jgi:hypothetical protein
MFLQGYCSILVGMMMRIFDGMEKMENKVYRTKAGGLFLIVAFFFMTGEPAYSGDQPNYSLGARTGIMVSGSMDTSFNLYEAIGSFRLPWSYAWDSGWLLTSEVDITAGNLRASQDNGFIASAGPGIGVAIPQGWMSFVLGLRVVYLNDYQFGGEDLGGNLSFVEELGVEFRIYSGLKAGYRFQHISNAGIYDNNPGLDMHILELRYRF